MEKPRLLTGASPAGGGTGRLLAAAAPMLAPAVSDPGLDDEGGILVDQFKLTIEIHDQLLMLLRRPSARAQDRGSKS